MTSTSTPPPATELKKGSVGLSGLLMQSITTISPAIAGLFTLPFIVSNAGVTAPLAYLGAFVIALLLGYVLSQFTRHMSSAGSYYTFTSRALGGRAGFVVGWIYLLFYPVVVAQVGSFMGDTLEQTLKAEFGITFPWWIFMIILIALCALTAWRGIDLSVKVLIVMGSLEILATLAVALWGFAVPGDGGVTLDWVNPANAPSVNGLFLGVVFAIFAITGWDAAAPLAEESLEPRKTVPRAVLGSIVILGVFLVLVSWGQITGWGQAHVGDLPSSSILPAFALGKQFWGPAWIIVLLALLNSALAVAIASTNASVRLLLGMARAGALPAGLARVHPTFRTPSRAIVVQTILNVLLGLVLPVVIGVANVYNVTGTWFTFALCVVYVISNVALPVYYLRFHRDEFNVLKHIVVPAIGTIALLTVVYFSLVPFPPFPILLAPIVVLAWLIIGIVVVLVIYRGERARRLDAAAASDTGFSAD
jgi:amino acid transporter